MQVVGPVVLVTPDVNEIALHVEQSPCPADALYLLSAHFVHVVDPLTEKVPASHWVFFEPPAQAYPSGHNEQDVCICQEPVVVNLPPVASAQLTGQF